MPQSVSSGEIRALTGLRGVAALCVVAYHFWTALVPPWLAVPFGRGYLAVDLFFVLSGFVMAMTYGERVAATTTPWRSFATFLQARIARVYPLLIALIAFNIALRGLGFGWQGPVSFADIPANLLLMQAWGLAVDIAPPSWSISAELAAYLAFPWLVRLMLTGSAGRALAGTALAAVLLTIVALSPDAPGLSWPRHGPNDVYMPWLALPVARCVGGFILGLGAWRVSLHPVAARWLAHPATTLATIVGIAGSVALHADPLVVALFAPLVAGLAVSQGGVAELLGRTVPHWLGLISYSIYLVHGSLKLLLDVPVALLAHVSGGPPQLTLAIVASVLLLPLAWLTYQAIEVPGRALLRGVGSRSLPKPV